MVYADDEPEIAEKYGIVNVPTLIVPDADGAKLFTDVGNIRKYMNECKGINA